MKNAFELERKLFPSLGGLVVSVSLARLHRPFTPSRPLSSLSLSLSLSLTLSLSRARGASLQLSLVVDDSQLSIYRVKSSLPSHNIVKLSHGTGPFLHSKRFFSLFLSLFSLSLLTKTPVLMKNTQRHTALLLSIFLSKETGPRLKKVKRRK